MGGCGCGGDESEVVADEEGGGEEEVVGCHGVVVLSLVCGFRIIHNKFHWFSGVL